tara:strand:+ start:66 stop:932 length:867 start_codon:yes stop_codon:yes gene_type:complete
MHYFKRNIGDYHKKAGRLSMLEHGAYTLLIDSCYDRERFPDIDEAIDWCWARTDEEIDAVKFVLRKFFILDDGKYTQNRISEEIQNYHKNAKTNKDIAAKREDARRATKARTVNEPCDSVNEPPPNHKPLTTNHKPRTNKSKSNDMSSPSAKTQTKGTSLPSGWVLPKAYGEWALSEYPKWTRDDVIKVADNFRDHWLSNANKASSKKADWLATWRAWVRKPYNNPRPDSIHRNNSVQEARLDTARQIQGGIYGSNREIKDVNPRTSIEGDGEGISKTPFFLRKSNVS